jgi:hypothetical protein
MGERELRKWAQIRVIRVIRVIGVIRVPSPSGAPSLRTRRVKQSSRWHPGLLRASPSQGRIRSRDAARHVSTRSKQNRMKLTIKQ